MRECRHLDNCCTTLAALAEPTTGMVRSSWESVDEYGLLFLRQQNQINVLGIGRSVCRKPLNNQSRLPKTNEPTSQGSMRAVSLHFNQPGITVQPS